MTKKIIITLAVTAVIVAGITRLPETVTASLPQAGIARIKTVSYAEYVMASGEISGGSDSKIIAETPIIVDEIKVKKGQHIKAGDTLATVDKERTCVTLLEHDSIPTAILQSGADFEDIFSAIPENITADVSGTVESISAGVGDYVLAGESIMTIKGTDGITITADIPEKDISFIKVGQPVEITGSSFPDKTYAGVVEQIADSGVKSYSGSTKEVIIPVKIRFIEADDAVRPGCTAKVKIYTSDEKALAVLPYSAINQDDDGEFVYVYREGRAEKKYIQTGKELPEGVEISSGLSQGDTILYPASELEDGGFIKLNSEE